MYVSASMNVGREDSLDDFDGFWLTEVNIVNNQNDNLNNALKTPEEKALDMVDKVMSKIRVNTILPEYTERCMIPSARHIYTQDSDDDFVIGSPIPHIDERIQRMADLFDKQEKPIVKKKKKSIWNCVLPCVKY